MDDRRFDVLTRSLGRGGSRRAVLKGLLGIGGVAVAGSVGLDGGVEAARRPTPTPKPRSCPGIQTPCGDACCCPDGMSDCGDDCCPDGQAECCDGACCSGTCYGEELCCASPDQYCSVDGCCSGVCVGEGQFCCRPAAVCGDACCRDTEYCCSPSGGVYLCLEAGQCCVDSDCEDGTCVDGTCIPNPPLLTPSFQITFVRRPGSFCSPVVSMSGLAPDTTYTYRMEMRQLSSGQTGTWFQFPKTTNGFGIATVDNEADMTSELNEVRASMDAYQSAWVLVTC